MEKVIKDKGEKKMETFQFYAERNQTENGVLYEHFEPDLMLLHMYGTRKEDVAFVEVEENKTNEETTYWGFYEMDKKKLNYIYPSKEQVQICSPDFFQRDVREGKGRYVNLIVTEILA